ncbi:MAG: hypothetical protein ACLFUT_10470 [Desulfobacteraceae bacterium]
MSIRPNTALTLCSLLAVLFWSGCAHQDRLRVPDAPLPENIFSTPETNPCMGARVGVFSFSSPDYAADKGTPATRILCNALEATGVFKQVAFEPRIGDMTLRNLINIARIKRYDLIITGKLTQYYEGSYVEAAAVTETIRVIRVRGGKPGLLWHAGASERISPNRSTDYILFQTDGGPAPSPSTLMKKNADKFVKMMLTHPPFT